MGKLGRNGGPSSFVSLIYAFYFWMKPELNFRQTHMARSAAQNSYLRE
jgi:hypothetical protein